MARAPFTLHLYRTLTGALSVVAPLWLGARVTDGKEDRARIPERYGRTRHPRPAGHLVWCHGASVGEALALLGLIHVLTRNGSQVLVTTGTVTSAALMAERLPPGAVHQYVPLDHARWVRRFLDHWRPDLVLWAESELWPNMLTEIAARRLPAYLVNARLSDRAIRGWRRWPGLTRAMLAAFTAVLAQSADDARRFQALGAPVAMAIGNLKLAADALPARPEDVAALKALIGGRPCWLAASIHPGEDAIMADAHLALKTRVPDVLTIVAPRHPPKADAMAVTFAARGLTLARRSRGEPLTSATDIYLADTLGELGTFYRACDLVVMGKSFAVGGGQNPAEPAKLGCAVIAGPDMSNFRDLTAAMSKAGVLQQITAVQLTETLARLLSDAATRHALGQKAAQFIAAEGAAQDRTLAILAPRLPNPIH